MTHSASPSILVVEDDEATSYVLTTLLRRSGCSVRTARHGQEALDLLGASPLPDLILLDLRMPVLSGWEFRRQQLASPALARIPVVVLSDDAEEAAEKEELGDVGYLQKPVEVDSLRAVVRRFVRPTRPGVLVVEDEVGVLKLLEMALRHAGFNVETASSGERALQVYREHAGTIAVVLLDVQMPGLDGPETLRALRELNPKVRSGFMSGHTGRYSSQELLELGVDFLLAKPFANLGEVSRALWDVIRSEEP